MRNQKALGGLNMDRKLRIHWDAAKMNQMEYVEFGSYCSTGRISEKHRTIRHAPDCLILDETHETHHTPYVLNIFLLREEVSGEWNPSISGKYAYNLLWVIQEDPGWCTSYALLNMSVMRDMAVIRGVVWKFSSMEVLMVHELMRVRPKQINVLGGLGEQWVKQTLENRKLV